MTSFPTRSAGPAFPPGLGRGRAALPNDPGIDRLLADPELGSTAKAVALALVKNWAWSKDSCFPADRTIAEKVGRSPGHVQRCLRQLERAGYIDREHTPEVRSGRRIRLLWRNPGGAGARPPAAPARTGGAAPARSERVVVEQGDLERDGRQTPQRQRPGPAVTTPGPVAEAAGRVLRAAVVDAARGEGAPPPVPPVPPAPPAGARPGPAPAPAPLFPAPAAPPKMAAPAPPDPFEAGRAVLAGLTPPERARYGELPEASRRRVLEWLGLGDGICAGEARRLLAPRPPADPPPWSLATAELLAGLAGRPDRVAAAAGRLAAELRDPGGYRYYHAVAAAVAGRSQPVSALLSAWRQGTGPRSSRPGAVFATAWKREAGPPG